jgi:hypothetical protein
MAWYLVKLRDNFTLPVGVSELRPVPAFIPARELCESIAYNIYLYMCFKIKTVAKLNHKVKWLTAARFQFPAGAVMRFFSFPYPVQTGSWFPQPPIQWVSGGCYLGSKVAKT